mgnify:CR=1 FL=1
MHKLLIYKTKPRTGVVRKCSNCNIEVYKQPCHSHRKNSYCSKKCHMEHLKKNSFFFPCMICEKKVFTQPTQIKYRHRKTCSVVCKSALLRKRAEERRIKFGYTKHQLDRLARSSPEAQRWRKEIFERDDYTCKFCGIRGSYLEADHIKPFSLFPELRYDLLNGRTLCRKCHDTTKTSAKRMREIYGKKENTSTK